MIEIGLVRKVLGAGAVLATGVAVVLGASAPVHAASAHATTALDWLESQMAANDHHLVRASADDDGEFVPEDDVGLTIDGLLAIESADRGADTQAQAASDWVVDHVAEYVGGASIGDAEDSRYAGELGKFLLFAQKTGLSGDTFDGVSIESDLRELMAENGRFVDRSDFGDLSNGVKQALDVLALALTDDRVDAKAVDFLLLQQCPGGGFRIELAASQCADADDADLDATSFALMALRAVDEDIDEGLTYLLARQQDDGGFGDNANSTGLAASVLRANGHAGAADDAAAFVESLQLTSGSDAGAILLDEDGYDAAVADGLDEQSRTIATRATSQGVLAFGLPSYDQIGAAAPTTTTSTTSTTSSSTSTTAVTGSSTTTTSTTVFTSTSTTRPVATATTVAGAAIARAGNAATSELRVAAGALVTGLGLVLVGRRRRIVYPFKR